MSESLPAYESVNMTIQGVKDAVDNEMAKTQKTVVFGYFRKFSFEEASGSTAIDSVQQANGIIAGDNIVRIDNGLDGKALSFDGTRTYVDIGNTVQNLDTYAISGWFKPDTLEGTQTLIGQQRDSFDGWKYNLSLENGKLTFTVNNGKGAWLDHPADGEAAVSLSSGEKLAAANSWNQFAVVRDGDTFTLYLNGEAVATETKAGIDQSNTVYTMWLGAFRNNAGGEPTACFKGLMDEVQIYNAVRTAEQIKSEYNEYQQSTDPDPIDPDSTEPKPTEPESTEPESTEPKPTETKPTETKPVETPTTGDATPAALLVSLMVAAVLGMGVVLTKISFKGKYNK